MASAKVAGRFFLVHDSMKVCIPRMDVGRMAAKNLTRSSAMVICLVSITMVMGRENFDCELLMKRMTGDFH